MAIYNKTELDGLAEGRFVLGAKAESNVTKMKAQWADERDSADTYGGVMSGSAGTLNLTTSLSDVDTFDTDVTPDNELFAPDQVNDRIPIKSPCLLSCGIIFQGEWTANVDMTIELWVIDSNNPTGVKHISWVDITQSGSGAGRRVDMYKMRQVPMGENAPFSYDFDNPVYIYLRAKASQSATVTQFSIQLAPEYVPFTIRDF
jgi:hypothetical protein